MCTLILAHRFFPDAPLVVAANRDEFLGRPASGPRVRAGPPRVLMPQDEQAGGTWLGLNEHGLFVGITNRAGSAPDPSRRSRGGLVVEALRAPSARALHAELAGLEGARHNPFHLLYADGRDAFVTWSDASAVHQYPVDPGVHVVTERSLGGDDHGRAERALRLFEERVDGRTPTPAQLGELLAIHGPDPLAGTCVHADAFGYGTRSSFVYVGGARPAAAWREGHGCRGGLEDLSAALGALFAPAG